MLPMPVQEKIVQEGCRPLSNEVLLDLFGRHVDRVAGPTAPAEKIAALTELEYEHGGQFS